MMLVHSPNLSVKPSTAKTENGHLMIGGVDTVELAEKYGTPLYVMDEQTMLDAIAAYKQGLKAYEHDFQILFAGKAFLCLAMCHLLKQQGLGLDVVSLGELETAKAAGFPADAIFLHGNNKSPAELEQAIKYGNVKVVVDSESELQLLAEIAERLDSDVSVLLRMIPDVEPDTHQHIVTGHAESKFGFALEELIPMVQRLLKSPHLKLRGLHVHIGSQSHDLEPYHEIVEILADCYLELKNSFELELDELDVGGGLGIAYTEDDRPTAIYDWAKAIADKVMAAFRSRNLKLPKLLVEPGRSIVGPAGVTLYRAGHKKRLPSGLTYLALDGGMADNPRPITYDAKYTAAIASRMDAPIPNKPLTLAGKYCESGDIIIKESYLSAETGDLIAVFGTGAYNFSMASNYNRTGRPCCVLVLNGQAEVVIERESNQDLLRQDRVPERLR